jgi:uncharacterized phage protein (TIGR01671 family)
MREIKFRAYNTLTKKIFNVDVLAISKCSWDCPDYNTQGVSLAYQPSVKVMQYTGLKDINGKDIYEGDIIRFTFEDENYLNMDSTVTVSIPNFYDIYKNGWNRDFEVIGNIYENKEDT